MDLLQGDRDIVAYPFRFRSQNSSDLKMPAAAVGFSDNQQSQLAAPKKQKEIIKKTKENKNEPEISIQNARRAAADAATQLEDFLHAPEKSASRRLLLEVDDDECSITRELRELRGVEEAISRELDEVRLESNNYTTCSEQAILAHSGQQDDDESYSYTSPVKQQSRDNEDLPGLVLSPLSASGEASRELTPIKKHRHSVEKFSNTTRDPYANVDPRDRPNVSYDLHRQVSHEGFEKFQRELDELLSWLRGESSYKVEEHTVAESNKGVGPTMRPDNTRIGVITALASTLFGRWEYSMTPVLRRRKPIFRTIQGTASVILAMACLVFCFYRDFPHFWTLFVSAPLVAAWIAANLPQRIDETVVAYLVWVAILVRILW